MRAKKQYFDMILSGEKIQEYREIKKSITNGEGCMSNGQENAVTETVIQKERTAVCYHCNQEPVE